MTADEFIKYCNDGLGYREAQVAKAYVKNFPVDKDYTDDDYIATYRKCEEKCRPMFREYQGVSTTKRLSHKGV